MYSFCCVVDFGIQVKLQRMQYPVLETPGGAIRESVAICRYIASLPGSSLYPAALTPTSDIRGQIDAWVDWSMGERPACAALM